MLAASLLLSGCASTPNERSVDEFNEAITFCMASGQVVAISGTDWECTGNPFWDAPAAPQ